MTLLSLQQSETFIIFFLLAGAVQISPTHMEEIVQRKGTVHRGCQCYNPPFGSGVNVTLALISDPSTFDGPRGLCSYRNAFQISHQSKYKYPYLGEVGADPILIPPIFNNNTL